MPHYRFAIVGAGIAGASAGYHLAAAGPTLLIEREGQPGYHSTGRSAALYTETYGNRAIRALTIASRPFLEAPPKGFTEHPLLTPRGTMVIARADQRLKLEAALAESRAIQPAVEGIDRARASALCPALRGDYLDSAFYEEDARDMDVHAIHQGFLRGYYGENSRGDHVFFGKWITQNGDFKGLLRGRYGVFPATSDRGADGWFAGVWFSRELREAGALKGVWGQGKGEGEGGFFRGVWAAHCRR